MRSHPERLARFTQAYQQPDAPWDHHHPEPALIELIDAGLFTGRTLLELGCGRGTDAMELARRGFQVTAVDFSPLAIEHARASAAQLGLNIDFRVADLLAEPQLGGPFDLVYDRGLYHSLRGDGISSFQRLLLHHTRPGSRWLCLCGNANESSEPGQGPPRVHEWEFRAELGALFDFLDVEPMRLHPPERPHGNLFWRILMQRRA